MLFFQFWEVLVGDGTDIGVAIAPHWETSPSSEILRLF